MFSPSTSDAFPGVGAFTIGTGAPSTRERKFAASSAAKPTTDVAFVPGATTTSAFPALNVTAASHLVIVMHTFSTFRPNTSYLR